ncbi:MAG: diacylglycerol kinase family lipid kinase [Spirochaetia bacterium]|nr:diacylglycerol kinase family lipid kinase [Spirochaetia bacterium]
MVKNQWCVIMNPVSGKGKAVKDRKTIEALFEQFKIPFQIFISEYPGHTVKITEKALGLGFKKFIAVGGDGTLNEIVNGIFKQKKTPPANCTLAAIPVGTGNDWAKNNQLGKTYESAVRIISENHNYLHDIGLADYMENGKKVNRFFINFSGIGFDSEVVAGMASRRFGSLSYFIAILKTFLFYRGVSMTIQVNGNTLQKKVFVLMTALGKYCGGGMHLAPRSLPDDGFFDVTLVQSMNWLYLLFSLPQIYNGKILSHPRVESFQTKMIKIESSEKIRIESDGELLGRPPVTYQIMKQSLKVIGKFKRPN